MAYEKTDKAARNRSRYVRWGVLGSVLVAITALVNAHQFVNGAGKPPGVDALCPFGGVESLFSLVTGAGFIEKTAASALILLIGTIVVAVVFRRSFCGQICPFGTLQGAFGALGARIFKKRPTLPRGLDRPARWLKYVVLAVFAVWTWQAAALVMRPFDPWATYAHITSDELFAEFGIGFAVLVVSLVGSVVYERFFCKYLCPMGAFLGLLSKFSFLGIRRDADACIDCGACDKACPMNIPVATSTKITDSECISCNECVNACPAKGALQVEAPGGRVVGPLAITGIVVALTALIIAGTTVAGSFDWKMPSLKESIEQRGIEMPVAPGDAEGADAQSGAEFDTSLIKGYMSMAEISEATGISGAEFTAKWGVPAEDLDKPMKEIKDKYEFSPDDVKVWVVEELAK